MRHIKKSYLIIILILFIISCPNHSIFQGLDKPNTEKIATFTGTKLLSELEKNADSQMFYKLLTESEREQILSNLDDIISSSKNPDTVTKAASFAVDILINTDSLVYAVIYDLVDPIIFAITGKDITASSIFATCTEPIQKAVSLPVQEGLQVISECFYNLFRITTYYDVAAISATYGSYSGGDLQKYLVSGLVSSVISGTQDAMNVSSDDIKNISEDVSEVFVNAEQQDVSNILSYLFTEIPKKLGETGLNIALAYKNQLLEKANILEKIAGNAGYLNLAKAAIKVLEAWAKWKMCF